MRVAVANEAGPGCPRILSLSLGLVSALPRGFRHDRLRSDIGEGKPAFDQARQAFLEWKMFDIGWVRVANPEASITVGQIVAVEAHTLGLWTLNMSRIVEAIDSPCAGINRHVVGVQVPAGKEIANPS